MEALEIFRIVAGEFADMPDEDVVDVTTIYVVPAEGATSQFFKLEAK